MCDNKTQRDDKGNKTQRDDKKEQVYFPFENTVQYVKKNIRKALQGIKAMGHMNRMFICSIALSSSKATPTKPGCM